MSRVIDTGGGAYLEGDISINGGDFVAKDVVREKHKAAFDAAAQLPEVRALVEALQWYATSGHYVQNYQYRNGELADVTSKARDDCGERARIAIAQFQEVER